MNETAGLRNAGLYEWFTGEIASGSPTDYRPVLRLFNDREQALRFFAVITTITDYSWVTSLPEKNKCTQWIVLFAK